MKILVISHAYPRWKNDWSANFIEALCLAYRDLGHEVTLFLPGTPEWNRNEGDLKGVRVITYNYFPFRKWQVFGYGAAMSNDQKPSVFQVLLLPLVILSGIFSLSRLLKKEPSIGLIHAHWAVPNSIIAILGRGMAHVKIPVITSFPGSDVTTLSMMGGLGRFITRKIIGRSEQLSCNSHDLQDVLVKLGLDRNKIDLVIYAVDPGQVKFNGAARDKIRKDLGITGNEKMLLMVGRFVPKKGFGTAFKAMKQITDKEKDVKMVVVGDGNLRSAYMDILSKDGTTDSVIFAGTVPLDTLHDFYSACDLFIMPTRRLPADGLNVAVVEAMSCNRPVVATNIGGNELVVMDGENGFLCDEDDHHQLAEKVLAVLNDDDLARRMGYNSRKLVEEKFNWNAVAQHYLNKMEGG
jgi:glycosyltransferase involved in cell wall biosynthesis